MTRMMGDQGGCVEPELFPESRDLVRMGYGWDCDRRSIGYLDLRMKSAGGIGTATFLRHNISVDHLALDVIIS